VNKRNSNNENIARVTHPTPLKENNRRLVLRLLAQWTESWLRAQFKKIYFRAWIFQCFHYWISTYIQSPSNKH